MSNSQSASAGITDHYVPGQQRQPLFFREDRLPLKKMWIVYFLYFLCSLNADFVVQSTTQTVTSLQYLTLVLGNVFFLSFLKVSLKHFWFRIFQV